MQKGCYSGSLGKWRRDEGRDQRKRLCEKVEGRCEGVLDRVKFNMVAKVVDLVPQHGGLPDPFELNHLLFII